MRSGVRRHDPVVSVQLVHQQIALCVEPLQVRRSLKRIVLRSHASRVADQDHTAADERQCGEATKEAAAGKGGAFMLIAC